MYTLDGVMHDVSVNYKCGLCVERETETETEFAECGVSQVGLEISKGKSGIAVT